MTAAWIAYALLVGAPLAGAALVAERALRHAGLPTRWAWAGALALLVALTALAPRRGAAPPLPIREIGVAAAPAPAAAPAAPAAVARARRAAREAAARVLAPVRGAVAAADRALPARLGRWLGAAWLAASALLLALLVAVQLRLHRARAAWPTAGLQGHRVRIAPDDGPAVVGLARPEIVVPRWLLRRAPDEQRIVLAHEAEHVRARDPLLLAAGCAGVALLPWHPVSWWMLARLRLAVELDCDRRVLRRGVAPRSYGVLLIDLAGRGSGLRHAAALADRASHLERRLLAMTSPRSRFPLVRGLALAALSLGGVLVACDTPLPTAEDVEKMDVAAVEKRASGAMLLRRTGDSTTVYYLDGERVDAARANAIAPERIASIEVRKGADAAEFRITTRPAGRPATGPTRCAR